MPESPTRSGAHERNRTADLLLTMQMLYRLSYVGAIDRNIQAGEHCSVLDAASECCTSP